MFLVVRGLPALLLYRGVLDARDRLALWPSLATQLPLVVAITTVAVERGHMRSSTAAALVGAAIISTLTFPLLGFAPAALGGGNSELDQVPGARVGRGRLALRAGPGHECAHALRARGDAPSAPGGHEVFSSDTYGAARGITRAT